MTLMTHMWVMQKITVEISFSEQGSLCHRFFHFGMVNSVSVW